jgi:polyphosphate kinase
MTTDADARGRPFLNRELSWLEFNRRVFEEASDPATPLLERVKFAAIAASNLDEFFMVRVAALKQAIAEGDATADLAGLTPAEQLAAVAGRARAFVEALCELAIDTLLPALDVEGIRVLRFDQMDAARQGSLGEFFTSEILPVLTPVAIDMSRPFPLLSSLSVTVAVRLEPVPGEREDRLVILRLPAGLPRLVRIADPSAVTFIPLEDLVRAHLPQLLPGQRIREATVMRLTRDSELELDDEGGRTHLERVERELRRRRRRRVVRLEVEATASDDLVALLRRLIDIAASDVYAVAGPLDLRVLMTLVELPGFDHLRHPPVEPANVLSGEQRDLFAALDERDVLLHHPYDGFDPVVALVAQAADDPDVLAIKQTLYRTSVGSPLIATLRRAAERGKQVTVLVELTARFDEARNIQWARDLEEAGAHVIYGVRGYKIHAKMCLIIKRGPHGIRRYVHLGTGNYNERTARVYTDVGLMTADQDIGDDATAFFNALTGYSDPPRLKTLVMAPTDLRRRLLRLIARERRRAEAGQAAEIIAKMNSLHDEEMIEALYAASRAGVRIRLNVRGVCTLRPGVPGVSDNIEVVSIVDRFLEHSRICCFHNGGRHEVYLSSADWMTRNLDRRIELMFPVIDQDHKMRVLTALRAMFRDTVKAWWLGADGVYRPREAAPGEPVFRVQEHLQDEARRRAAREWSGVALVPEQSDRR